MANLNKELRAAELRKVGLVCCEREFETVLMHDTQLLCDVISPSKQHPAKIKPIKDPLLIADPTAAMMKFCRDNKTYYNKGVMAVKFAKHLTSLDALKDCDIFRYFVRNLLGKMPKGWRPYVYKPRGPNA